LLFKTSLQDVRFAVRVLRRSPLFASTATITIGIGLGLNIMLFTLFNAYVLRTASVKKPRSLYLLGFATKRGAQNWRFS
jgi:macrolide transport system ATP-binding/permease protein